jgi:hypothetical protein
MTLLVTRLERSHQEWGRAHVLAASFGRHQPGRSRGGRVMGLTTSWKLLLRQICLLRPLFPTRGYPLGSRSTRLRLFSNFTFLRHTWVCFKSSTARSHTSGTTGIHPTWTEAQCGSLNAEKPRPSYSPQSGGLDETHLQLHQDHQASR